jgi:D-sedoheptulose 7-phosphate isomerase
MSDFTPLFDLHLGQHREAIDRLQAMAGQVQPLAEAWESALKAGHKILFFGNGGSAADAQHLAAELVVRYRSNRTALAGIALTTDTSILTANSNDFGFDSVFARQIEALARPGDVVVGISTSGKSRSIIAGLESANAAGCVTMCFTGADGAECARLAKHVFHAPSSITARIQECHLLVGHLLCDWVEQRCASQAA